MDLEAERLEFAGDFQGRRLIRILHANENLAGKWQRRLGTHLAFRIGDTEVGIDSHHLAGGPHFGAENDVDAWEFNEWEDGFFHRVVGRDHFFRETEFAESFPSHHFCRELGERNAGGLADKGRGARGAGVDLEDVNDLVFHSELHIHQTADLELDRHRLGGFLDRFEDLG